MAIAAPSSKSVAASLASHNALVAKGGAPAYNPGGSEYTAAKAAGQAVGTGAISTSAPGASKNNTAQVNSNSSGTPATTVIPETAPKTAIVQPPNAPPVPPVQPTVSSNALEGQIPLAEAQANLTKGGLTGGILAQAQTDLASHYKQGLQNANANGGTAPDTTGAGATGVKDNMPQPTADTTQAQAVIDDNKAHQQYLDDYKQAQESTSQKESLTSEYQRLSKESGIPELNTELMNMKNVIDGTEQDIRNEVAKAGGFATNSQVLSLASARNVTLIKNYNDLLETRTNLQNNLNTMIGLEEKDRAYAQQQIDQTLNFDQQNIQFADKALTNSQDALTSMQKSEGWDGIYKAALASGDPQAIARINSVMGNGFDIATMAQMDAVSRQQALSKTNLENQKLALEVKTAQNNLNDSNNVPNPQKAGQPGYSDTGVKYTPTSAQQEIVDQWKSTNMFGQDGAVSPQTYKQAKAWWTEQGLNEAQFDNIFGQYTNTKIATQYK